MTHKIVECIPNFSEGRRIDVVDAIVTAIAAVQGIKILDRSSDIDHNRSVVTFAGLPESVVEAAFAGIATAAKLINLEEHTGAHPRIGAADVVPFVPLAGTTLDECVELARILGRRVGDELSIPVYLYEAAATRPERVNLEFIRRDNYEGLKSTIAADPQRAPDFGPARLGRAGAVVIGARNPLIAFNVYLTTDEIEIARKIAEAVRHSSGGLRFVKALGLHVGGRAQISMNLTDFTRTPVARVVEMIRREAARYGAAIHHTELIGLIPQAALVDAAQWYLQLDDFSPDRILENQLAAAFNPETPPDDTFLTQLSAGTAAPGGGGAAAYAGAMAAALAGMAARLTIGKKKYADVEARMQVIIEQADALRLKLQQTVGRDAEAYNLVMAAYQLPKRTSAEQESRREAINSAVELAGLVQLEVIGEAVRALELLAEIAETGNVNAVPDAATGAFMARAAIQSAAVNVRANAALLKSHDSPAMWLRAVEELSFRTDQLEERIRQALHTRAKLDFK